MDDFFGFRRMITPVLVQVLFWIGLIVVIVLGIKQLGENALIGLGILVVGPLIVRIYCEFLILFFRINETLTDILHVLGRTDPGWSTIHAGNGRGATPCPSLCRIYGRREAVMGLAGGDAYRQRGGAGGRVDTAAA